MEGQRASADFVEARRTALEHYLRQLAAHPVLSRSQARPRRAPCMPSPGGLRSAVPSTGGLFVSSEGRGRGSLRPLVRQQPEWMRRRVLTKLCERCRPPLTVKLHQKML